MHGWPSCSTSPSVGTAAARCFYAEPVSSLLHGQDIDACVHRLALTWGAPTPVTRPPLSLEAERRIREARRWRAEVLACLEAAHPDAVRTATVDATADALQRGVALLLDPRLPDDVEGHRRAQVQALVRVGRHGENHTYAPVLIRYAEIVEPSRTRLVLGTTLESFTPMAAQNVSGVAVRSSVTKAGLQLAHALSVLKVLGHADPHGRGGVVDRGGRVWWFDLASDDYPKFNLEAYGHYYRERRAVLDAHEQWQTNGGDFPTRPAWHRACDDCDYATTCKTQLASSDDVSLVRFTTFTQQDLLRDHGVATRVALSGLDPARAAAAKDRSPMSLGPNAGPEEHLGSAIAKLDELIYRARVAVRGTYLRIAPPEKTACPTADVEVDVDMESYDDVTYLWGAAVRATTPVEGVDEGYHAFVSFAPLTDEVEAQVFRDFWTWFADLRARTHAQGKTFAAYCFWSHAEDSAMDRALSHQGEGGPTKADVDAFRQARPSEWIDIYAVVREQIQTDGPLGLKQVAPAAGFAWRDEAPGGEASMSWYETAVGDDPDAAPAARNRLLAYNEDDCLATRALRDWLNGPARQLPHRDDPR